MPRNFDSLDPVGWRRSTRNTTRCPGDWDTAYFLYGSFAHTPDAIVYDECGDGAATADTVYRITYDARGSVRVVARTNGTAYQTIAYDAWGVPTTGVGSIGYQPFGFAGGIWMGPAGFWHFGARDYEPAMGRWTARDPIGFNGGYNLYMYAGNDPVNRVDPTGLDGFSCFLQGAAAGLAGALVVGGLLAGAAALGVPVIVLTFASAGAAVVGGSLFAVDLLEDIDRVQYTGSWDPVWYDAGAAAGGLLGGRLAARPVTTRINGTPSRPWSLRVDMSDMFRPSGPLTWVEVMGTGPNPGHTGGSLAVAGAGAGVAGGRGCGGGCN